MKTYLVYKAYSHIERNLVKHDDILCIFHIKKGNIYDYIAKAFMEHLENINNHAHLAEFFEELNCQVARLTRNDNEYVTNLAGEDKQRVYTKNLEILRKEEGIEDIIAGELGDYEFDLIVEEFKNFRFTE